VAFEKHLLVDGANVLHASPEWRALMKRDLNTARALLVQRLTIIHDTEAVRVTIVFDGRGPELVITRPSAQLTLSVLHTSAALTADDVIEQLVGRAADAAHCVVVTGDQAERRTIEATGAIWMPPADLMRWTERAEQRLSAKVTDLNLRDAREWRAPSPS
jgi:uncharacterized protein